MGRRPRPQPLARRALPDGPGAPRRRRDRAGHLGRPEAVREVAWARARVARHHDPGASDHALPPPLLRAAGPPVRTSA
jgi:hypothetical protein